MLLCARFLMFLCLSMLAFDGAMIAEEPPLDVKDVQQVREACRIGCLNDRTAAKRSRYLIRMGEKAFLAYEAILSDPKAIPEEVLGVFGVLDDVEADRRRFAKYAVLHLTDAKFGVRLNAVILLMDIGSSTVASPVVALLSDKRMEISLAAARTLAAIGGPNEVVAMDVWLRGVSHSDDAFIREEVQKCRDELKKRLDEAKDPKKRAQKRQRWWKDLTGIGVEAAVEVSRAVRELSAGGTETVAFLKDRVHPVPAATQKHLDQLLADLDSDSFQRREAATSELTRGEVADSVLEKALAHSSSPEQKRRLEVILEDLPNWKSKNPALLRQVRAVWVLQQIGTPEAKALLEKVAAGAPSARLTQKAKDALESLKKR